MSKNELLELEEDDDSAPILSEEDELDTFPTDSEELDDVLEETFPTDSEELDDVEVDEELDEDSLLDDEELWLDELEDVFPTLSDELELELDETELLELEDTFPTLSDDEELELPVDELELSVEALELEMSWHSRTALALMMIANNRIDPVSPLSFSSVKLIVTAGEMLLLVKDATSCVFAASAYILTSCVDGGGNTVPVKVKYRVPLSLL